MSNQTLKTIGILGGMGPLATMDLATKIINHTDAKSDNDHIHSIIDNYAQIPDRTAFILGGSNDPTQHLIESAKKLESMGADFLIMPCNTAHYFYNDIVKSINIPFLNMITETAKSFEAGQKVGLLATQGTYSSKIYEKVFNELDIEVVIPPNDLQALLMDLIYEIKSGKSNGENIDITSILDHFYDLDVTQLILGCTELPVAFQALNIKGNFFDPTKILALSAIKLAGKNVKLS